MDQACLTPPRFISSARQGKPYRPLSLQVLALPLERAAISTKANATRQALVMFSKRQSFFPNRFLILLVANFSYISFCCLLSSYRHAQVVRVARLAYQVVTLGLILAPECSSVSQLRLFVLKRDEDYLFNFLPTLFEGKWIVRNKSGDIITGKIHWNITNCKYVKWMNRQFFCLKVWYRAIMT